jgi:hypothetical protein
MLSVTEPLEIENSLNQRSESLNIEEKKGF